MIKPGLIAFLLTSSMTVQAQTLDVDWLYLSGYGSWVSRSQTLLKEQEALKLPVTSLNSDQFYWYAENPNTQLSWQTPNTDYLPQKGSSVEIIGEPGLWLVQAVNPSHLVLQQGKTVRYWPQSQWHQLEWTSAQDFALTLQVRQPSQKKNDIFYAWQTPMLTADISYRLQDTTLYQELTISNQTDETLRSNGYSFARNESRPVLAKAMRSTSLEASSDAIMLGAPEAGESQGVPTLSSSQPLLLEAGSNIWLPVSDTELSSVERQYQLQWDSRQAGLHNAQMQLVLKGKALPDIPGSIKVGVFDHQLATQDAFYQPQSATEARLNLGQSALISMTSHSMRDNHWRLDFSNRSQEDAVIDLTISHWNGKQSLRTQMTVKVKAKGEKAIDLELTATGLK
ncbi:MAG: hypothetical protein P8X74_06850 [Reinekea sp.]|jgi:hypothetical protein